MSFAETFAPFFADFGVLATLNGVAVPGIFDEKPLLAFDIVGGNDPRFTLRATDLPIEPRGLPFVIGARSFTVRDWQTDGTGLATLQLEAA